MGKEEPPGAVPPFSNDPSEIQLMRRAYEKIGTQKEVANFVKEWLEQNADLYDLITKEFRQQEMSRVFDDKKDALGKARNSRKIVWTWMHAVHPDIIKLVRTPPSQMLEANSRLAQDLHLFLEPGRPFALEELRALAGRYAFYHAYSREVDDTIMIEELVCGVDDDPERFSITSPYPAHNIETEIEGVSGLIIPYGRRFLFQGRFNAMQGPYIFTITSLEPDPRTGQYYQGEGVLLAAGGGSPASAYPVLMVRQSTKIRTGTMPIAALTNSGTDNAVKRMLNLGVVRWQSR